jgi:hypothetical protein
MGLSVRASMDLVRCGPQRVQAMPGFAGHRSLRRPRVQANSAGAVAVSHGTLVLDGVAISDTRAVRSVRVAGGGPRRTEWCAQVNGGAVFMKGGTVTFQGGSSITRTTAVRCAQTRARVHAHVHASTQVHVHKYRCLVRVSVCACACAHA